MSEHPLRILFIANETVEGDALHDTIRRRALGSKPIPGTSSAGSAPASRTPSITSSSPTGSPTRRRPPLRDAECSQGREGPPRAGLLD